MAEQVPTIEIENPELTMLKNNRMGGYNYRERRHDQWNETYLLYRDRVITNRLIQRQTVNLPLMKQSIRTLLKDVDDMPVLYFENLDNDKQAEMYKNEYWNLTVEHNNMEVQDIVDKKQVLMYGRSFTQWQIVDGWVKMTVEDPMDILVSRYTDPTNLNSSRFLIHTHIFTPLSIIERNKKYDQTEVTRLKNFHTTEAGLVKAKSNDASRREKDDKMSTLGVQDVDNPVLGETYVELELHFVWRAELPKDKDGNVIEGAELPEEEIYLYVVADDMAILMKEKLEDVIDPNKKCKDHFWRYNYPYDTWGEDTERQDFWNDGTGDIIRQSNKILNAWYSQLVENRTLKNLNMNLFDSSIEGFVPQTWNPVAFGMYGIPVPAGKKIEDVFKQLPVADLSESLDEIQFVLTMMEKATGATATQQGVSSERQITLGEVKMMLGEAKERVKGMAKFYTPSWKRRGMLFSKLLEAGADRLNTVTIHKKGKNTSDLYSRDIEPKDWETPQGYNCKVWSQEEKNTQDMNTLQKLDATKAKMPNNMKLNEIYERKLLEFSGLTPQEINDVMEEQRRMLEAMANAQVDTTVSPVGTVGQSAPTAGTEVNPNLTPMQ